MKTVLTLNSTLQDLTLHIADLDATVSTQAIAQLFETSHQVPGVILKHDDEFLGMISRRRYFEFMSRPYSLDLFLGRPIQIFYQVAQVEFLTLTSQTPITTAIKKLFDQSRELIYEPIVVQGPFKTYQLLDVYELLLSQLKIQDLMAEITQQSQNQLQQRTEQLECTINQLQQTQAQLIQTEKMSSLGQLVAGIAHEINNPISFIHGNLFYGERYVKDILELVRLYQQHYPQAVDEIQKKIAEIDLEFMIQDFANIFSSMQNGTERIRDIVLSLQNFSRIDESGIKWVDIHQGIDSTLLILNGRLNGNGKRSEKILIEKHYEELPQIECSPGQINQVLINILNNSIDALDQAFSHFNAAPRVDDPEKESHPISAVPTIKIWTKVIDPDRIGIWISDNGTGMNLEVRERLFDPFFTTKPVGSGTGLGLSISYEIVVNQHQGTLACNSELGQGTEFMVVLPIEQPKANATLDLNRESSL